MSKKNHAHGHAPAAPHAPDTPAPAAGAHAKPHGPSTSTFITIWLTLGVLTLVEIFVPQVYSAPWNHNTKILLLIFLASAKAILVAAYFMHLKWETRWVRWIALMPAYMALFAILLMCEEYFRPLL
jgi:cytochrome c oxidase subunit 4